MVWVLVKKDDNSIHDVQDVTGQPGDIPNNRGPGQSDFQWIFTPLPVEHSADWMWDGAQFVNIKPPTQPIDITPTTYEVLQWMLDNGVLSQANYDLMPVEWRSELTRP
jgi:hypothetical protein